MQTGNAGQERGYAEYAIVCGPERDPTGYRVVREAGRSAWLHETPEGATFGPGPPGEDKLDEADVLLQLVEQADAHNAGVIRRLGATHPEVYTLCWAVEDRGEQATALDGDEPPLVVRCRPEGKGGPVHAVWNGTWGEQGERMRGSTMRGQVRSYLEQRAERADGRAGP